MLGSKTNGGNMLKVWTKIVCQRVLNYGPQRQRMFKYQRSDVFAREPFMGTEQSVGPNLEVDDDDDDDTDNETKIDFRFSRR
jgi:hypothetical protein